MSKYAPLQSFLSRSLNASETLSFAQLERLLGFALPASASAHRPWWANDGGTHTHAKAWLNAGWKVASVSLGQSVTFVKEGERGGGSAREPLTPLASPAQRRGAVEQPQVPESEPAAGAFDKGNYIPVLCCSGSKTVDSFIYQGRHINFVASPSLAPHDGQFYCAPDDLIPNAGKRWRDLVAAQNADGLVPAYQLYQHNIYRRLYQAFGERFYIFSAGWGIVRAGFKLPAYNITFSNTPSEEWVKRKAQALWRDFNHLQDDSSRFPPDAKIILFAGTGYAGPFCRMTGGIPRTKVITHRSINIAKYNGFEYRYCPTRSVTNWFYEAVDRFLAHRGAACP